MKIAISFTMTLRNIHNWLLDPTEIDEFHLGCRREHVFPEPGLVPMEVSWLNKGVHHGGLRSWHGECGSEIKRELCEPEALRTWDEFYALLEKLDKDGRVKYQVGNYIELYRKLLGDGHEVWYEGKWLSKSDAA